MKKKRKFSKDGAKLMKMQTAEKTNKLPLKKIKLNTIKFIQLLLMHTKFKSEEFKF